MSNWENDLCFACEHPRSEHFENGLKLYRDEGWVEELACECRMIMQSGQECPCEGFYE